ncbi:MULTISPECIES: 50S ribosomal protein L18 [Dehalococcoides]|jgi:large subunit ribosomal protein L18|uniref:Large ribosomal subunit protein uL18 n=1 Tax=Dehalococcoides mccartyi (strain VS) TaxID=311424 RepID=D2BGY7_DEHMV|nr:MULTISPECIES: 50S ribosomal protein L18 [Dehalococcoides]ACZ61587.1 ribosomal protein L18 [Dehalococcoides mccartyi VS]AHB13199.1 50S ribosomal protein L18 [Dehalococcoides mccartyi GY50]QYY58276.1 50S ribosomal protein L18 [Dehalococcoides mccartyi]BAQ34378.1 50S ribosomal protein L18 [Dehalococcoides sp. UCH007]
MAKVNAREARIVRHERLRKKVSGTESRPRLCVFRSIENIYTQVINDNCGSTLVQASTKDAELKAELDGKTKTEQAVVIGNLIAKRSLEAGISEVVFDRGGYKYHGRVKALAEAARSGGLKF